MKFGTTETSRNDSESNRKSASRKLGSSFQNPHSTAAKIFRCRISAACASVGALESGFTVEPCATMRSALSSDLTRETFNSLPRAQVEWAQLELKADVTAGNSTSDSIVEKPGRTGRLHKRLRASSSLMNLEVFSAVFLRRVFGNPDRTAEGPRVGQA